MRRRPLTVACLAVLGAFGAVASRGIGAEAAPQAAAQPTAIAGLLPADAVALVQVTEMGKLAAAFEQSMLAEAIKGSQVLSYARTLAGAAAQFGVTLVSGVSGDELRACLGQHAALALLNFKDPQELRQRPPIVLLLEATDPKRLQAVLATQVQLFSLLREGLALSKREQAGATVHEVALPNGGQLCYAFRGNVLVAGGREAVNALLDAQAANAPKLADAPSYLAVRQGLGEDALKAGGLSIYVSVRALLEKAGLGPNTAQLQPLRALGLASAQAAGLVMGFEGRRVRERLFVHLAGPPTGLLKFLTEGEPVAATLPQFVPASYAAVLTLGTRDVGLWQRVQTLLTDIQGPAAADFLETVANHIEQQAGIHPKRAILDTFGDELSLALDLSQFPTFFGSGRQPRAQQLPVLLAARLRDAATLKATADRIAANQQLWEKGIQRTTTQYDGASVHTFRTPFDVDIRPSYTIAAENVFLLSLRPEPLGAALDAGKAKKGFPEPALGPAHVLLQINDAQLLKTLLDGVRKELPEAGQRLVPEADRLFAGLHGYQAALRREALGVSLVTHSDAGSIATLVAALLILDQGNAVIARRVEADFARIAAALEAYREKKRQYPETIEQLVPDFLPELANDRFAPARPYGYSRGSANAEGRLPDAWVLTSVGPDKRPDVPVEQFDPQAWSARLQSKEPEDIALLKRLLYRFQADQHPDERKNDDEGDLYRLGGRGLSANPAPGGPAPTPPAPVPPKKAGAPKREDF